VGTIGGQEDIYKERDNEKLSGGKMLKGVGSMVRQENYGLRGWNGKRWARWAERRIKRGRTGCTILYKCICRILFNMKNMYLDEWKVNYWWLTVIDITQEITWVYTLYLIGDDPKSGFTKNYKWHRRIDFIFINKTYYKTL
jgi:hypothetical protein